MEEEKGSGMILVLLTMVASNPHAGRLPRQGQLLNNSAGAHRPNASSGSDVEDGKINWHNEKDCGKGFSPTVEICCPTPVLTARPGPN